jgi:hypothetical protein
MVQRSEASPATDQDALRAHRGLRAIMLSLRACPEGTTGLSPGVSTPGTCAINPVGLKGRQIWDAALPIEF